MAVSVTVFACYCILNVNDSRVGRGHASPELRAAGFLAFQSGQSFRRLEKRREGRGSQSELKVRLPAFSKVEAPSEVAQPLYPGQSLSAIEHVWDLSDSGGGWEHLPADVRRLIDAAKPASNRWDRIELHHSTTRGGNASMLQMYHSRVRGLKGGLAYHFVIGNGAYAYDGEIEVGDRWSGQAPAGSAPGTSPDPRAISICLIGDLSSHQPTSAQIVALDELVHYLRAKLGHIPVKAHHRAGDGVTSCPGRYFPRELVIERLNK